MSNTPSQGKWLALTAALLGWMFDGMEMGLFPQVASNSLKELLGPSADKNTVDKWFGVITAGFLVGAATGGVVFGWLGDKVGRVRAMTISVLMYSLCSGVCTFATEPWHLAVMRFLGALGMGGEWALGIALVMEVWPNTSRAALAGWIGAFGNLGYTIVGLVLIGLNHYGDKLPGTIESLGISNYWSLKLTGYGNWRLMMLIGAVPALLTLLIRLFVPESEKWTREKEAGHASQWSSIDLVAVMVGAAAACGIIAIWAIELPLLVRIPLTLIALAIALVGYIFPARQFLTRSGLSPELQRFNLNRMLLGAGLSGVPLLATWAGVMWVYNWLPKLTSDPNAKPITMISSSLGAAIGCIVGAMLAGWFGRRIVYAALCVLSMITLVCFYSFNTEYGTVFVLTAGLMGLITASFYGWLPLYLPELFPTMMRASGQGFGFNFGRVIASIGALQTGALLAAFDNSYARATVVTASVYLVGLVLIYFAPETKDKPLPE